MIRHVVVAKFKEEITLNEIEGIIAALERLPEQINEILFYEVGVDISRSGRSYDLALVSTFSDIEALARYQVDATHMAVATQLRAASRHMAIVDYEVAEGRTG